MPEEFGPALRDRRRAVGLSQRELAARASLDFSYISKVENGRMPPPAADTIVAICRVLGVAPEALLALTRKIPSAVHQTVSGSPAAQQFLREAQEMALTDREWGRLLLALRRIRDDASDEERLVRVGTHNPAVPTPATKATWQGPDPKVSP